MPTKTSPSSVAGLEQELFEVYLWAEGQILAEMARSTMRWGRSPRWLAEAEIGMSRLLEMTAKILGPTAREAQKAYEQLLVESYVLGSQQAIESLRAEAAEAAGPGLVPVEHSQRLVTLLSESVDSVNTVTNTVLRTVSDEYREVIREASLGTVLGFQTREEVIQHALNEFATRGVTGFVDKAGRRWNMAAYTRMASRTASHRASVYGRIETLKEQGHNLVRVSDHAGECPLCRPWEGKVLALELPDPQIPQLTRTYEDAEAAGLLHPGCRHQVLPYFHGVSGPVTPQGKPDQYEHEQRQRQIENKIREWKRREVVGDPKAPAKIRAWQERARENVKAHPEIKRRYDREKLLFGKPGEPGVPKPVVPKLGAPRVPQPVVPKAKSWKGLPAPTPPSDKRPASIDVKDLWKNNLKRAEKRIIEHLRANSPNGYTPEVKEAARSLSYDLTGGARKLLDLGKLDQDVYDEVMSTLEAGKKIIYELVEDNKKKIKDWTDRQERYLKDLAAWRRDNGLPAQVTKGLDAGYRAPTVSDGARWMDHHMPAPTGDSAEAFRQYTGSSAYPWNEALREAEGGLPKYSKWADLTRTADMGFTPAPEDFVVTRYVNAEEFDVPGLGRGQESIPDPRDLIGTVQRQYGYLSTSIDPQGAHGFRDRPYRMEILVPQGYECAWLMPISHYGSKESEVLVRRNTRIFIHDVYEDPKKEGVWVVEAEILPDGVEATPLDIRSSRGQ